MVADGDYFSDVEEVPLLAPADLPLSDDVVKQLVLRAITTSKAMQGQQQHGTVVRQFPSTLQRKRRAFKRWRIWQGSIAPYVAGRIDDVFENHVVKGQAKRHITNVFNPARDIVSSVCQVYKSSVRRTVDGASDSQLEGMHKLLQRAKIDLLAPQWNQLSYFCGPLLIIPRVSDRRIGFDTLLPHAYDVVLDEDDPYGPPVAVAFASYAAGVDMVVIDASGWRFFAFDDHVGEAKEIASKHKPRGKEEQFTILRLDCPIDAYDWFCQASHSRLVDGTIEVGLIATVMSYVRKAQNKQLLSVLGDTSMIPKGQGVSNPEGALVLPTPRGGQIQATTLDFDTPPDNFIRHMRWLYEAMAESTGVQMISMSAQPGNVIDLEFAFDGLTEIRNSQIPHCREFDKCMATLLISAARNRRGVGELPDLAMLEDGYRVDFGRLSRRFNDPRQEMDYHDWRIRYGLESPIDLLRSDHPELSDEGLERLQKENLKYTSEWHDEVTKRNLAVGSGDAAILTSAEANGAMGPKVRDGKRPIDERSAIATPRRGGPTEGEAGGAGST